VRRLGRPRFTGADLYYEVHGDGPAIVLVHGFSLDGRMWDEQVAALRDIATVVRLDLRGYGRSSDPAPGVAYAHSADLLALLDHLNITSAVFVGLSMGGLVALHTALVAPQRVQRLILLDSVLDNFAWDDASRLAMLAAERAASTNGVRAAKDVWLEHPLFAPARRDPALATRLARLVDPYSGFHWTHADPAERWLPSPNAALEHIQMPTIVAVGELDVPSFRAMAAEISRRVPGARSTTIADAGHMVNLEAPEEVNALLRNAVSAAS
jgi:3-oxoadipate enol-lactonase